VNTLPTHRFDSFIAGMTTLVDRRPAEAEILSTGAALLRTLIAADDWLDPAFARDDPQRFQLFLLHCDPQARFSVVSSVWAPGQASPIHDHTVWGVIGVLRGGETEERYRQGPDGRLEAEGAKLTLHPGDVSVLSPAAGDVHKVSNLYPDRVSISIHVYGADIGQVSRSSFDLTGGRKTFVSSYANAPARTAP
jgi:predicted metal-dependent enzyme (double-stranded beta helix superfamily)